MRWIDSSTDAPFWQNTDTGEVTWTNPDPRKPSPEKTEKPKPPPRVTLTQTELAHTGTRGPTSGPNEGGRPLSGGNMHSFLGDAMRAGAHLTYVAPGAYAAGCVVNQYGAGPMNGGGAPAAQQQQQEQRHEQPPQQQMPLFTPHTGASSLAPAPGMQPMQANHLLGGGYSYGRSGQQ